MKVEVTLYNTNGEEIDGEVIDVGDRIDVNDPPDWQRLLAMRMT
jgi:hypothetical protein